MNINIAEIAPTVSTPSTQAWAAIATAIAGAVAVVIKKKYNRRRRAAGAAVAAGTKPELVRRTEFQQALESVGNKVEANHKEVLGVLANQGHVIEQRLDRLDVIVARLDERTKN